MSDESSPVVSDKITAVEDRPAFRRVLNPVDRAGEILFGLIMVMTFTGSLNVAQAGNGDVKAMLIAALGCNLAWGIIDGAMFLMSSMAERQLSKRTVQAVRNAPNASAARAIIAESLPPLVLPALAASDLDRIRLHLLNVPSDKMQVRVQAQDITAALAVFLLVFGLTFPVVAPFLFVSDPSIALLLYVIAIGLMLAAGCTLGRLAGRALRGGLLMAAVGLAMVALAISLGG